LQIGDWVLHSACAQAATWFAAGISIPISVNLAARQLSAADLAERVRLQLERYHLPGRALCLEVSQDAVLQDTERVRDTFGELKRLGVAIALDNFGATGSSLSLPANLPLDMVKVDRRLIGSFTHDREARALVAAIVALAHEKRLTAVAVGIETNRQLALARELDFEVGQGFLLHRPDAPERLRFTGGPVTVTSAPWRPRVRLGGTRHHS
jgi:EAL domain-containing protein (putative c-di-GMP-specific phosphodiesterase class I)